MQERERLDKAAAAATEKEEKDKDKTRPGAALGLSGPGKPMVKKTVLGACRVVWVRRSSSYMMDLSLCHTRTSPQFNKTPSTSSTHTVDRQSQTGCGTTGRRSSARRRRSGGGASRSGAWPCMHGCSRRGRRGTG